MEDVTIHLRGGQSITVRVEKCTWKRSEYAGGLFSLELTYPDPVEEVHQLNYLRLDAVDALETRPVPSRQPDNGPRDFDG